MPLSSRVLNRCTVCRAAKPSGGERVPHAFWSALGEALVCCQQQLVLHICVAAAQLMH